MKEIQQEEVALEIVNEHLDAISPDNVRDRVKEDWGNEDDVIKVQKMVERYARSLRSALEIWKLRLLQQHELKETAKRLLADLKA